MKWDAGADMLRQQGGKMHTCLTCHKCRIAFDESDEVYRFKIKNEIRYYHTKCLPHAQKIIERGGQITWALAYKFHRLLCVIDASVDVKNKRWSKEEIDLIRKNKRWTKEEIDLIRKNMQEKNALLAKQTGHPEQSVATMKSRIRKEAILEK